MGKLAAAWARFVDWFNGSHFLPQDHQPTRIEELREWRIQQAQKRAMDALQNRPANMTDTDRLILARSVVRMLEKSLA